jgi:ComF family protein
VISPLLYRFPVDRLVQRFKFNRHLPAGRLLALLMLRVVNNQSADLLVPVPLHWKRLFQRGYNQAVELALPISRETRIPLLTNGLCRRRETKAQSGLDARARRKNLGGAFRWRHRKPPPPHVVLIDDVMTTGATATECTKVLLNAGAVRVDIWTAARAPLVH